MTKFNCYYDNGTGWLEGPYIEDYPDWLTAYKTTDVGYGAYITETDENPNERCSKCRCICEKQVCPSCGWPELNSVGRCKNGECVNCE